jgi:hypothetical protein
MAENVERTRFGSENYYVYWSNAFEGMREDTDPTLAHNITVATLGGLLLKKDYGNIEASIQRVLESLAELHRRHPMPQKERVALELIRYIYRELKPEHLTAADRLAIESAIGRLDNLARHAEPKSSPWESSPQERGSEAQSIEISPLLVNQMEPYLTRMLGESLWSKLSSVAKDQFKHGQFYFMLASRFEGEGGDFSPFVMAYSRGLLAEIRESVRGPLGKDQTLESEFRDQFGKMSPEWSELIRYMDDLPRHGKTGLGRALLAQRVRLNHLEDLRKPFEELRALRNRAAHGPRIDMEKAIFLNNLLLSEGFIRTVVEYFPKPTRR